MAGEILGHIQCDGCGGQAGIKKIKNSELLYLHCPSCGCDRKSGALIQAKWRTAIEGGEQSPQLPELAQDSGDTEWQPSRETHSNKADENPELIRESGTGDNSGILKAITGGLLITLGLAGMIFKAVR